ncbi:MAG: DUF4402 domain-containing protein [Alphaproteobacteria bacterium]
MKKILGMSLLALTVMIGTNAVEAVDADGDARIDMVQPLSIAQTASVDFGTVAVDGAGSIAMTSAGGAQISCTGFTSASCPATGTDGLFTLTGKASTLVNITSTNATLENADASTLTFVPAHATDVTFDASGDATIDVGGSIALLGTESSGEFNTTIGEGVPYVVTAVYP